MSKKMLLLFSHKLDFIQKTDAKNSYNITEFVSLPQDLQSLWSAVPTEIENLNEYLEPLKSFIKQNFKKEDVALIQGDFGASYMMVNFCKNLDLVCVYAKTRREVEEVVVDGTTVKKSIFKHKGYREYE